MFTELVEVAIRSLEIEPTMPVATMFNIGDSFDVCSNELLVRRDDVIDPQPSHRTRVEMIMLRRIRAEHLKKVTILSNEPTEAWDIDGELHAEGCGEELGCPRPVLAGRPDPDYPLDPQSASLSNSSVAGCTG